MDLLQAATLGAILLVSWTGRGSCSGSLDHKLRVRVGGFGEDGQNEISTAKVPGEPDLTWSMSLMADGDTDADDLKKATLLNLLRVMGETRMLQHEVRGIDQTSSATQK